MTRFCDIDVALGTTPRCEGGFHCEATVHIHGCFADEGNCDEPHEHVNVFGESVEPQYPRGVRFE